MNEMDAEIQAALDRIEGGLQEIALMLLNDRRRESWYQNLTTERLAAMANNIDQFRDELRTNTDAVSARIDQILAEIQATSDNTASPETLADLQAISQHLKEMGASPQNPFPQLAPRS